MRTYTPEYCADPRTIVELESDANGCLKRWVLNACLRCKRAVGMSGIKTNETIHSGQNSYYCKKIMIGR